MDLDPLGVGPIDLDTMNVDPTELDPMHLDPMDLGPMDLDPMDWDPMYLDAMGRASDLGYGNPLIRPRRETTGDHGGGDHGRPRGPGPS